MDYIAYKEYNKARYGESMAFIRDKFKLVKIYAALTMDKNLYLLKYDIS